MLFLHFCSEIIPVSDFYFYRHMLRWIFKNDITALTGSKERPEKLRFHIDPESRANRIFNVHVIAENSVNTLIVDICSMAAVFAR